MNTHTIKGVVKEVTESKVFRIALYTFGILVVTIFIFQAGIVVGFHKASFDRDWGDNYAKNFGPTQAFRILGGMPENLPNAHGAIGKIIEVNGPILTVEDRDGTEKAVLVDPDTIIRKMREDATTADLVANTSIVVIGNPNTQGQIEAKLIRIMPTDMPPASSHTAPSVPATN
jgi:hypothetical protein